PAPPRVDPGQGDRLPAQHQLRPPRPLRRPASPVRGRGSRPAGRVRGEGGRARRERGVRSPARPPPGRHPVSGSERHTVPVDVHLIAVRGVEQGPEVLLSRRAGTVYAAGHWHFPSGHVDGPFEDVVTALVREAYEETGLVVDPDDARVAVTVHHRAPAGGARVGFFFEVRRWSGTPDVREPKVCDAMDWFPFDALPQPMVAYCRAGLDAYRAGVPMAVHFQEPGDTIGHDPSVDRLRLMPAPGSGEPRPGREVREFTEQTVGRITTWTDVSWARTASRVWRAQG